MGGKGKQRHQHGEPGEICGHDACDGGAERGENANGGRTKRKKKKSGNAYEMAPKVKNAEVKS